MSNTCVGVYTKDKEVGVVSYSGKKIIITNSDSLHAFDGDIVRTSFTIKNNNYVGKVSKIIKHNTKHIVGIIKKKRHNYVLFTQNSKLKHIKFKFSKPPAYTSNSIYLCKITRYPKNSNICLLRIDKNFGAIDSDVGFISSLLFDTGIDTDFSDDILFNIGQARDYIPAKELKKRHDLRHLPFITIDGEDAKDFDDAIFCEEKCNSYLLYVAIADVDYFVKSGSKLDQEAYLRGTSIYFPKQVVPMLPNKLSNNLCSLRPNKDRLVMFCKMLFSKSGELINYDFASGVICSNMRLTYSEVQNWYINNNYPNKTVCNMLKSAYKLSTLLLANRKAAGAVIMSIAQEKIYFAKTGKVSQIISTKALQSASLIEEFMLITNVCAADLIMHNNYTALFRIHAKPSQEKFIALQSYLNCINENLTVDYHDLSGKHYTELIDRRNDVYLIQQILKSMSLAIYSPINIGHFGLGYQHYIHFTSPIRRYPDILAHRIIKHIIGINEQIPNIDFLIAGEHLSKVERLHESLERKVISYYKCHYAKQFIGKKLVGKITAVVEFGVFININELFIDGLVHISNLGDDYYIFDSSSNTIFAEHSDEQYCINDEVDVIITSIDFIRLFINLRIC